MNATSQIWSHLPAEYAIPASAPSLQEAYAYCERLARTHYENFSVATWFLPKRLRQHFFNLYAYCRISDDLGDETGDCAASLQLANFWQDVTADFGKGRIYLPVEDLRRYGVSEDEIRANQNTGQFCEMMRFEVQRAREWFERGFPLVGKVSQDLAIDIELFS